MTRGVSFSALATPSTSVRFPMRGGQCRKSSTSVHGLRLEDRVLPSLDERDPQRPALAEMREALSELRFATKNTRGDTSARTDHHQNVERIERLFITESTRGGTVTSPCPRCDERPESASALLSHFEIEHPFQRGEKILIDPGDQMIAVDRAVGRCREAIRNVEVAIAERTVHARARVTNTARQEVTCPQCTGRFVPSRSDQTYCSSACRTASYKERKSRACN